MSQNTNLTDYVITIREHHLDTFGHVNNATYLELLEEARWELITQRGYGLAKIQKDLKGPVILEVQLKFLKELRLRQKVRITTEVLDYKGKIGHMKQQMIHEDGKLAAEAIFVFGLFDLAKRALIDPTPEWNFAIGLSDSL
ncbi:MAG: acyl-CoA thioesterase [Bdellovibrionales bacterium]|nr:acyl-CoA thioesterase [Bdellovibrionales bacterium]